MPDTLEQVMAELSREYQVWVKEDLKNLKIAFHSLPDGKNDLFRIAHDMKGQGATFDYPLITVVGEKLCRWIEKKENLNPKDIEKTGKFVDLIDEIIQKKIVGEDSQEAKDIIRKLEKING